MKTTEMLIFFVSYHPALNLHLLVICTHEVYPKRLLSYSFSVRVGAHTLGVSQCQFFKNRLKGFDSTHDVDPTLNPNFANMLSRICSSGDNTTVPLDWTSSSFDNSYFHALQMGGGLLTSDQSLFTSSQTQGIVSAYAMSQDRFFSDFARAIVKLGLLNVKEGDQGEVRLNCHKIN